MSLTNRLAIHHSLSTLLATSSDHTLTDMITNAPLKNSSFGATIATIKIQDTPVFIKKIPLTDLEQQPGNIQCTANLFDLPLYYQYGLSSAGFNVWREVAAQAMTTQWVLTGLCPHFPLMYHWRILPTPSPPPPTSAELKKIECSVKYWGGSPAIRKRLMAKQQASAEIILFLEYIPFTLEPWFYQQIQQENKTTQTAIRMIERDLITTISFMKKQGLLHLDAHFNNILTDGHTLYFADFGLALSSQFQLSAAELHFFQQHQHYDLCLAILALVSRILAEKWNSKDRKNILEKYANANNEFITELSPYMTALLQRYAPIALLMKNFNRDLLLVSKDTPFPHAELAKACLAAKLPLF